MKDYVCEACGFYTTRRTDYNRHTNTMKHIKKEQFRKQVTQNTVKVTLSQTSGNNKNESDPILQNSIFVCDACGKSFKHKNSYYRHKKHHCILSGSVTPNNIMSETSEPNETIETLKNEIKKLSQKCVELEEKQSIANQQPSSVTNVNNVNNGVIGDINITLNNYKDTDYDYLTDKDYLRCFNQSNHCVKKMIETVHFDQNRPENMNIYIASLHSRYIMLYKDNKWGVKDRTFYIDDLYEANELVLENFYDEYKTKYPGIIKSFERYLEAKDDDEYINSIKRDIVMMLYNNRNLVKQK